MQRRSDLQDSIAKKKLRWHDPTIKNKFSQMHNTPDAQRNLCKGTDVSV